MRYRSVPARGRSTGYEVQDLEHPLERGVVHPTRGEANDLADRLNGGVLSVACPFCGAAEGVRCVKGKRPMPDLRRSHRARFDVLEGLAEVPCKNGCGRTCPPPKLHGRRAFCSDGCRSSYWSKRPDDRPRVAS